ncbi:MAG: polysaccharide biosynthesis/export family protein [Pirellulaceae bacterium]|nr:polysaccharide biosynthesis/export family protein [Pirellulaceae bacterium]
MIPIDVSRLGQEPPRQYLLDGGDILGIYIEGILPFTPPDQPPIPPPVNFPAENSLQPPSLGYPIAVQEDGSIALPLIKPLNVKGMSVDQVRELVRKSYLESRILKEDGTRVVTPIVTIIQERTVNVVVIRQDLGATAGQGIQGQVASRYLRGGDQSAAGNLIKLRAYQNDVLHALMATGGLPGLNAKNEVRVLRADSKNQKARDEFVRNFYAQYYNNQEPCGCPPPLPDDPSILRIPLRMEPGVTPSFAPEDMILREGDVVFIDSREAEVFYTGGLLRAGEFPIPRDYDLDVLGAMALAGTGVGTQAQGGFGGLQQTLGAVPPGRLYIVRKLPCDGQVTIEVDINKAINNPRDRPLVQPGDTLLLQYKPQEELLNFGLGTFFTYGIQSLIQNLNR